MPIYVYRCSSCDNRYETREGFEAPSTQSCPSCGAVARRVLFAPPIVFKGSGFYVTDSRGKNGAASYPSNGSDQSHDNGHSHDHGHDHGAEPSAAASSDSTD